MKKRLLILLAVAVALTASLSTAALAAKDGERPDRPGKPTTTTSPVTTVPDDGLRTCLDVGDAWHLGTWDPIEGAYKADTLPICIDLNAGPDHRTITDWEVTWSGTTARASKHGAEAILVFEEQLHENVYADSVIALPSGATGGSATWSDFSFEPLDPEPRSLVFVAMPHSGAKWTSFTVTVKPLP